MSELSFKIDPSNIKEELCDFAANYESWSTKLAEATNKVYALKLSNRVLRAKKETHIRQNPTDYGFVKLTEDTVTATLDSNKEVVASDTELLEAESEVRTLRAIVDSLETKRSSLKYLCELTSSGFLNLSPITGT